MTEASLDSGDDRKRYYQKMTEAMEIQTGNGGPHTAFKSAAFMLIARFEPTSWWFKCYELLETAIFAGVAIMSTGRVRLWLSVATTAWSYLGYCAIRPHIADAEDGTALILRISNLVVACIAATGGGSFALTLK